MDTKKNKSAKIRPRSLAAYVTATGPTHAIDGWALLGRAVDSCLRGDTYAAVHFAYYAELRAAMSLLATEGIGILSTQHPIVAAGGKVAAMKLRGTHSVVWPVLYYWAGLIRATAVIDEAIRPYLTPLTEWITRLHSPVRPRAIARGFLGAWGLDLSVGGDDRSSRNLASYRPSELRRPKAVNTTDVARFIEELWTLFEPDGGRRFPQLERHLLRKTIWKNGPPNVDPSALSALNMGIPEATAWATFLNSATVPWPLELAEGRSAIEDELCHLEIISRACLLLFVATSSARTLLRQAGCSAQGLEFWWKRFGEERGLWLQAAPPDQVIDLWADIATAIEGSRQWRLNSQDFSLRDYRTRGPELLDAFGAFELLGIWCMLP